MNGIWTMPNIYAPEISSDPQSKSESIFESLTSSLCDLPTFFGFAGHSSGWMRPILSEDVESRSSRSLVVHGKRSASLTSRDRELFAALPVDLLDEFAVAVTERYEASEVGEKLWGPAPSADEVRRAWCDRYS